MISHHSLENCYLCNNCLYAFHVVVRFQMSLLTYNLLNAWYLHLSLVTLPIRISLIINDCRVCCNTTLNTASLTTHYVPEKSKLD